MAEKNNELLMKNHQAHHTGTKSVFEANTVSHDCEDNYEMGVAIGITVAVDIVVAVIMTIIEVNDIIKIIIIDLVVVIRTIKIRKMRGEHLPNMIFKKALVIDVECLAIFKTMSYSQTSCGYVSDILKVKRKEC